MGEAAIAGDCENEANIQIALSIDGKRRITKEENAFPGELVTEVTSPVFSISLQKRSAPPPNFNVVLLPVCETLATGGAFNRK